MTSKATTNAPLSTSLPKWPQPGNCLFSVPMPHNNQLIF